MTDVLNIAEIAFENGQVRFRYSRVMSADGTRWIRQGLFRSYHQDGTLSAEGEYHDGLEQGEWRTFHENGQMASRGAYDRGEEVGDWTFWSADGSIE